MQLHPSFAVSAEPHWSSVKGPISVHVSGHSSCPADFALELSHRGQQACTRQVQGVLGARVGTSQQPLLCGLCSCRWPLLPKALPLPLSSATRTLAEQKDLFAPQVQAAWTGSAPALLVRHAPRAHLPTSSPKTLPGMLPWARRRPRTILFLVFCRLYRLWNCMRGPEDKPAELWQASEAAVLQLCKPCTQFDNN